MASAWTFKLLQGKHTETSIWSSRTIKVNWSIIIWFVHLLNYCLWYLIYSSTPVRQSANLPIEQMKWLSVLQVTIKIDVGSNLCSSLSTFHKITKSDNFILSVCLHGPTWLPLDGLSLNLIFEYLLIILRKFKFH